MSKIGKINISIPEKVKVAIAGNILNIEGPLGKKSLNIDLEMFNLDIKDGKEISLKPKKIDQNSKRLWGMNRSLINNAVIGSVKGYEKILELVGVGYRAALKGNQLNLQLGYSHDINYDIPEGIKISVEKQTTLKISGFDKQLVGLVVSKIKTFRKIEPYKGKGIREKGQYRIFAYIETQNKAQALGLIATKFLSQGASGLEWSTTKGIKAYVADSVYANEATSESVMFANEDGYVYEMESTNGFDGANIPTILETPYMPITDSEVRKTAYKLSLYTDPGGQMSIKYRLLFDFDSGDDTRIVQPEEITIGSTSGGGGVFIYGASNSVYGGTGVIYGSKVKKLYKPSKFKFLGGYLFLRYKHPPLYCFF